MVESIGVVHALAGKVSYALRKISFTTHSTHAVFDSLYVQACGLNLGVRASPIDKVKEVIYF
jgi:hypothetical protein